MHVSAFFLLSWDFNSNSFITLLSNKSTNAYIILYDLYINEPYITVHAKSGLSNKIRVILSYLYRANKEDKK